MSKTLVAITGASSGIGAAYARKLAAGHSLLLIARRADRLNALAEELTRTYGCEAEVLPADLSDPQDLESVAGRIESVPDLALLVNNAGFGSRGLFWENDWGNQANMLNLHIQATARLTHAALRNMIPRDFGAIVNVASVASFIRGPGSACYASSKSFVAAFTEGLYLELKATGSQVSVQALCPGYTYSEFHDRLTIDRHGLAGRNWWHTAEDVVEQSIQGLRRRKLYVIPGWRYRLVTSLVTRVPESWRLWMERQTPRGRKQVLHAASSSKKIGA